MAQSLSPHARIYWITWSVLLALTVVMLAADGASIPQTALVALLLGAMSAKAVLIAGNFMHLREERSGLVLTATTCRRAGVGGVGNVATGQAWQSLMRRGSLLFKDKPYRRFAPKCDLSSVHPENTRIAARRRKTSRH